jgi:hypothetical protein
MCHSPSVSAAFVWVPLLREVRRFLHPADDDFHEEKEAVDFEAGSIASIAEQENDFFGATSIDLGFGKVNNREAMAHMTAKMADDRAAGKSCARSRKFLAVSPWRARNRSLSYCHASLVAQHAMQSRSERARPARRRRLPWT